MEFRNLSNVSVSELTVAFNEGFSDYSVPVQVTEEQMAQKIKTAKINMMLSAGAFVESKLVGFILHGVGMSVGEVVLWNGGTAVIPNQRGAGLTRKMYEYISPVLKDAGYRKVVLEVIIGNDPAIRSYQNVGFEIVRHLDCYKGTVNAAGVLKDVAVRRLNKPFDWPAFESLRSWSPTYQNENQRVDLLGDQVKGLGAYDDEKLVGYILYHQHPAHGDIFQFAVAASYRRKGIGRALFAQVNEEKEERLKIINVDAHHEASAQFFKALNMGKITGQYDMILKLD